MQVYIGRMTLSFDLLIKEIETTFQSLAKKGSANMGINLGY